jgi:hypothetical protein
MSEENEVVDGLISRLTVIDGQPLDQRAIAFAQLHDELRSVLEGGRAESARSDGTSPR